MMDIDPIYLAVLLFAVGLALLAGELLLPTGGVLGVLGALGVIGSVWVCYTISVWLGLGVTVALLVASPFIGTWVINIWPKTPVGKRVVLQTDVPPPPPKEHVELGSIGVAVTELRPMGECDFEDLRVEAIAEYGMIPAGQRVKVVALSGRRPTVRAVKVESTVES